MKQLRTIPTVNLTFCSLILALIYGCAYKEKSSKEYEQYFRLLVRNPHGCTHIINIDDNGNGVLQIGTESNSTKNFQGLNENLKSVKFKISDKEKLQAFKETVNLITTKKYTKIQRPKDVIHYELYIENVKKIDAYGRKSEIINSLKKLFEDFYSFEVDYTCEKYVK